jgi:ubiquinone/menaquinone biosynthesis C-methylase UbiE
MKSYWNSLYESTGKTDNKNRLKAVCNPEFSLFANGIIHRIQTRIFHTWVKKISKPGKTKALDIGCGGGRWIRRLSSLHDHVFGLDLSFNALKSYTREPSFSLINGSAANLPFHSSCIHLVTSVTVIQHLGYDLQNQAGDEISCVVKKEGYWLLLEHLAPFGLKASDVCWEGLFPRSADEWTAFVKSRGFEIIASQKFQYLPFMQMVINLTNHLEKWRKNMSSHAQTAATGHSNSFADKNEMPQKTNRSSFRLKVYRKLKSLAIDLSLIPDFILSLFLGKTRGTHLALLAKKI